MLAKQALYRFSHTSSPVVLIKYKFCFMKQTLLFFSLLLLKYKVSYLIFQQEHNQNKKYIRPGVGGTHL
jgi:hypothetical protein